MSPEIREYQRGPVVKFQVEGMAREVPAVLVDLGDKKVSYGPEQRENLVMKLEQYLQHNEGRLVNGRQEYRLPMVVNGKDLLVMAERDRDKVKRN
mgnify:FL=1